MLITFSYSTTAYPFLNFPVDGPVGFDKFHMLRPITNNKLIYSKIEALSAIANILDRDTCGLRRIHSRKFR